MFGQYACMTMGNSWFIQLVHQNKNSRIGIIILIKSDRIYLDEICFIGKDVNSNFFLKSQWYYFDK